MFITDYISNYFKYGILGNSIRIDASSACQLRCPTCHQTKDPQFSLRRKHLKFDNFKKFVDQYPTFKNIELSDDGEIFLNPELEQIIQYAYLKKVALTVRNGVNLNYASERVLEYLVKYQLKILLVSIDGATNETYQIFRKGGSLQKVKQNIEVINRYKRQYKRKFPVLVWQFIAFGHNEHEIKLAREMAKTLNMRFFLKFNLDTTYSPTVYNAYLRKEMGYASFKEYEDKTNNLYSFSCHQLWLDPQISPDGDFLGCCYTDTENAYGNVFQSGLQKILKSEKFLYAKKMLLGKAQPREDIPCFNCRIYNNMRLRKANFILTFLSLINRLRMTHL